MEGLRLAIVGESDPRKVRTMAWITRGTRRYYYRSVRVNGRPTRQYVGNGPPAEAAAAEVARRKTVLQEFADQRRSDHELYVAALAPLLEFEQLTDLLTKAALISNGYHQHARGAWRRRRDYSNDPRPEDLSGGVEDSSRTSQSG